MTAPAITSGKCEFSAERPAKAHGAVSISAQRCKGCGYCAEFCPLDVLAMTTGFNAKGYHYPEVVAEGRCSGCDLCGMYCPDFAIHGARITRQDPRQG